MDTDFQGSLLHSMYTLPEKGGPSTFACKSKNASGRIGIFSFTFDFIESNP